MTLHRSLRDLVTARGAGIVADAEVLRAALEDYLTEDEVTPGDTNVLVDAVRLGAVRRALELLERGAEPQAAVSEAGTALARERGSDDPRRSIRAVALLCFALGHVDEAIVMNDQAPGPAADSVPANQASADTETEPTPTTPTAAGDDLVPPLPVQKPRRRRLVLGAVGIVAAVGLALWWFALRGDSVEDTVEAWFAARSCEEESELVTGAAAEFVLEKLDSDDGYCATYDDYRSDYKIREVTENGDRATVEVDGTQRYVGEDESLAGERNFSLVLQLRRIDGEWLVSNAETTFADE